MQTMKQFKELALSCSSPQGFYEKAKQHRDVPQRVSEEFARRYGHKRDAYMAALTFFYDCHRKAIDKSSVKDVLDNAVWQANQNGDDVDKAEDYLNNTRFSVPLIRSYIDDSVVQAAIELMNDSRMGAPFEDYVARVLAGKIAGEKLKNLSLTLPENTTFSLL